MNRILNYMESTVAFNAALEWITTIIIMFVSLIIDDTPLNLNRPCCFEQCHHFYHFLVVL